MGVYHLLCAQYALDDLKKQRLKVSLFADLNDPFELLSVELSDRAIRKKFMKEPCALARVGRTLSYGATTATSIKVSVWVQ